MDDKIFLASVFDDALRGPILAHRAGAIWRPEEIKRGDRSIEDVCRDLIRRSRAFIALLDWRSGRELAFANLKSPVTVLEIELLQALFQRMPIFIFVLPTFSQNERLQGLVSIAERWRFAQVWSVEVLEEDDVLIRIGRITDNAYRHRIVNHWSQFTQHFHRCNDLEMEFLNRRFHLFQDAFDAKETENLITAAANTKNHAARLATLWTAMRQLCSAPYDEDRYADARPLWERALTEWVRSAAWYGMHDASPFGLLAAVNSLIWIRACNAPSEASEASHLYFHGTHGARASAIYSMAKRCWRPVQRWTLLGVALREVNAAIVDAFHHIDGYLAIRGSIYRQRLRLMRAVRDHEKALMIRQKRGATDAEIGEALSELGWSYAWILRLRKARQTLATGVRMMRSSGIDSPSAAGFFVRALRKHAAVQLLTLDIAAARKTLAEANRLARDYLVRDQVRGII